MRNAKMRDVPVGFSQSQTIDQNCVGSKMFPEKIDIRRENAFAAELNDANRIQNLVRSETLGETAEQTRHGMVDRYRFGFDPIAQFGKSANRRLKRKKRRSVEQRTEY